jgi:hypothetical protein
MYIYTYKCIDTYYIYSLKYILTYIHIYTHIYIQLYGTPASDLSWEENDDVYSNITSFKPPLPILSDDNEVSIYKYTYVYVCICKFGHVYICYM